MDEELPGRFRDIQVVFKEAVDGKQGLLIQGVNGVLLKDFLEEHLAKGGRQLVNQAANAQVLIVDHIFFRVEHLAHINGNLRLLIGLGQIPQMGGNGADAHHHGTLGPGAEALLNGGGNLVQLPEARSLGHLPDQYHVPVADVQHEVVLPVGEHGLDHIGGHRLPFFQGTDHKNTPGHVGGDP